MKATRYLQLLLLAAIPTLGGCMAARTMPDDFPPPPNAPAETMGRLEWANEMQRAIDQAEAGDTKMNIGLMGSLFYEGILLTMDADDEDSRRLRDRMESIDYRLGWHGVMAIGWIWGALQQRDGDNQIWHLNTRVLVEDSPGPFVDPGTGRSLSVGWRVPLPYLLRRNDGF